MTKTKVIDPTKQLFIVEGAWEDNDGSDPITADWVAAASADEAEAMVTQVRSRIDTWTHGITQSFAEHIASEERILARMKTLTVAEAEASWEGTKKDLGYEEAGECLTCGTQCDDEGICPVCAALERAEEVVLQATQAVLVPGLRGVKLKAAREALQGAYAARAEALAAGIDSCRKCGKALLLRDVVQGDACADPGEGEEEGNVFVYCSSDCQETH